MAEKPSDQKIPTKIKILPDESLEQAFGIKLRQPILLFLEGKSTDEWKMTYSKAPELLRKNLRKFVNAGFFYFGDKKLTDLVRCAYCGIGLYGWTSEHDPKEEHRRHNPDCPSL